MLPFETDADVMVNCGATAILHALDVVPPPASAAWIVNEDEPAAVGEPPTVPDCAPNVNPAGSEPVVNDHVYGLCPPITARVEAYDCPTLAVGDGHAGIVRHADTLMV